MRLNNREMAIKVFNDYLAKLAMQEPSEYIDKEIEWTRKTIYMAKGL